MCRTLLLLLLAVVASSLALTQLEPEPEDDYMVRFTRGRDKGMVKTLHMLQELDDFYSKLSRPRLEMDRPQPPAEHVHFHDSFPVV